MMVKLTGILFPKLFWPTVRKNCSSDRGKLLKFENEGREAANLLRSQEKFIQTVKGQYNFWNRMLFLVVPEGFSNLNILEQLEFKMKKQLGLRNLQENIEKIVSNGS